MRLKVAFTTVAAAAVLGLLALPADAAPKKKTAAVRDMRGHTVYVSRDENGRTHTRIIIQKRSYLDPGTETFPGERRGYYDIAIPEHRADSVLNNTVFGSSQLPLPGPYTLPSANSPWLNY